MAAVVLALCAAALWGTGDFFGGLATRRVSVLIVLAWSQLIGFCGAVVWIAASSAPRPGSGLAYALGAGLAGSIGLGCLYRGMAVGTMGIVAPISATAPVVPLAFDVARGDVASALQWVGIALALVGIVIVARDPGSRGRPVAAGVGLALAAALGIGLFLTGLGEAARQSAPWAVGTARLGSMFMLVAVLAVTRTAPSLTRRLVPLVVAVGIFDTGANALVALAASRGSIGIVGVLSSLYPIATILLARAILHERLGPTRTAGGLVALSGAALIAAG